MSLASSILKGGKASIVYRCLGRREWFSRNEGPRRFLATTPAKVPPPQPTDGQKTDAQAQKTDAGTAPTAPASTAKLQAPSSPAAPRPAPSTSPAVNAGQKVAPVGQKVQTPPSPPKHPASSPQTSAPGQKAQPSQAPPTAQKVTPVISASPVQKVQASSPPPGQKAPPPSQAPQPPPGSRGAPPAVPANNRRKILFASVATAGLVSGILYWQSSRLDVHDRAATATAGLKDKNDGDTGNALVQDAEAQQLVMDAEEKTSKHSENIQHPDGGGSVEETREAAVEAPGSSAKDDEHHERQETVPETPTTSGGGREEHPAAVLHRSSPKDLESSSTTVSASDGPLKVELESSPEELKVTIEEQGGGSDAQVITAVIPAEEAESFSVSRRQESGVQKSEGSLGTDQRHSDALPESPEVTSTHINVITAIHAAEKRQAEIDAAIFKEQLDAILAKHQHELRAVEHTAVSYKEQLHRVEEGMDLEKIRHAEEVKQQQQQAERKLQTELKLRDEEAQQKLEEAQLLSKAEALAAIAEERAILLRDIGSIKLQMEAMNHALDSKSEEAREGHTVNKLSLGTFALESALRTGSSITQDVSFLLETAGGDPLVEATVHSLPKDVVERGTLTPAQLDRQLGEYKTTLTELALIPVEGGGVLSHLLARLASMLKVSERGVAEPEGVEAILYQVENHVKDGKLVEAAELLENGLAGTSAQKLASQWAIQARNRAILEQACALLRAHAATIAVSRG